MISYVNELNLLVNYSKKEAELMYQIIALIETYITLEIISVHQHLRKLQSEFISCLSERGENYKQGNFWERKI